MQILFIPMEIVRSGERPIAPTTSMFEKPEMFLHLIEPGGDIGFIGELGGGIDDDV